MGMLDIVALLGLEWLSDKVEQRYGLWAGMLFALAGALVVLGIAVLVLVMVLRQ
jgi:hypothetical protein